MEKMLKLKLRALLVTVFLACFLSFGGQIGCKKGKDAPRGEMQGAPAPKAEVGSLPFTLEGMPNSDIALGNVFKAQQPDPVEVLKGWKVRYTAPAGVAPNTAEWLLNGNSIGMGSPHVHNADALGTFTVTLKVMGAERGTRTLVVGEVQSDAFSLTAGGTYVKDATFPNWVVPPLYQTPRQRAALVMAGKVSKTVTSPVLLAFQWGFVQSVERTGGARWDVLRIAPDPSTQGTFVRCPSYLYSADIPPNTNDAQNGQQLYGNTKGKSLGEEASTNDSPGARFASAPQKFPDNTGKPVLVQYAIQKPNVVKSKFKVWQVVFHTKTEQYVPLKEQEWKLEYDSTEPGPWKAQPIRTPIAASSKPSPAENVPDPYLKIRPGPAIELKLPR